MAKRVTRPSDLREACVQEALSIIETSGVEQLSLREVARRLGVSHQAPYKHFPSRDHILAEIVARAFDSFARYLDGRDKTGDPDQDLGEMGRAYLRYAQAHPLQYRLMFGTPLPEPHAHPEMMRNARHAFALLSDGLQRLSGEQPSSEPSDDVLLDALFIWSALHGLASISGSCVVETLDLPTKLLEGAGPHVLNRIGAAMGRADC